MNILFNVVLLVCVFKAHAKPLTPEEGMQMFIDTLNACKAAEGASEDDAKGIISHGIPTTREGGCLNACVMEKVGIMKDNKFNLEGAIAIAGMGGDPQKPKNIAAIGAACEAVSSPDRCEVGAKIMVCLHEGAAKIGITPATDLM